MLSSAFIYPWGELCDTELVWLAYGRVATWSESSCVGVR